MAEPDYQSTPSPRALDDRIALIWRLTAPSSDTTQRVSPDGCCEIILHRGTPPLEQRGDDEWSRQPKAFLYGPLTRVLNLSNPDPLDFVAIRLHPWAVGCLGVSPKDWRDRAIDLEDIHPGLTARLLSLFETTKTLDRFAQMARPTLDEVLPVFAAMPIARTTIERLETGDPITMAELANMQGLTERTLSRRLERAVGLNAKSVMRITRFHRARSAIKAGADSLSNVAADCGYADQAHMTRDFRRLSGETPRLIRKPAIFDPIYGSG